MFAFMNFITFLFSNNIILVLLSGVVTIDSFDK